MKHHIHQGTSVIDSIDTQMAGDESDNNLDGDNHSPRSKLNLLPTIHTDNKGDVIINAQGVE